MLRRRRPPARVLGLRRLRARRRGARELLQRPSRRGEHHGDRLRPRRPRPLRLQAQRRRHARRLRHRRRPDARRRRERRHRQGGRRVLRPADPVHDDRRAALQRAAVLVTRQGGSLAEIEQAAPPGVTNYRASRDQFTSHSEPTIAMDPLDHDHLMAGSKMYENNDKYLFKIGTYESHDGGRTWDDQGQLPGYCEAPGQCDPANEAAYRTTSDISLDFDDEGNVYANVLDAPGGTAAFKGFNMTVHVKRPGQPWSGPTVVHDNRVNALTNELFLDDKNWIAVDNHTDVSGGANAPARRQDRDDVRLLELRRHRHGAAAADRRHALARRRQDVGRPHAGRQHPVPGQPEDADLGDRLPPRDRPQGRGLRDVVRQPAQRAHAVEVDEPRRAVVARPCRSRASRASTRRSPARPSATCRCRRPPSTPAARSTSPPRR